MRLFRGAGGVFERSARIISRIYQDAIRTTQHQPKLDRGIHIAAGGRLVLQTSRRIPLDYQHTAGSQGVSRDGDLHIQEIVYRTLQRRPAGRGWIRDTGGHMVRVANGLAPGQHDQPAQEDAV